MTTMAKQSTRSLKSETLQARCDTLTYNMSKKTKTKSAGICVRPYGRVGQTQRVQSSITEHTLGKPDSALKRSKPMISL